jgi:hypothetical protein
MAIHGVLAATKSVWASLGGSVLSGGDQWGARGAYENDCDFRSHGELVSRLSCLRTEEETMDELE